MTPIHKQEQNGAGHQRLQDDAQAISQESRELCFGHLARSHDKIRVNDFAVPRNMAIALHIVRRVAYQNSGDWKLALRDWGYK